MNAPRKVPPALVDWRVLLLAALVASPAAYRATQGLLSMDEVLTRYLLVAVGCVVVSAVVRALWPLLAGEPLEQEAAALLATAQQEAAAAGPAVPADPGGLDLGDALTLSDSDLDLELDGLTSLSAFDDRP